MRRHVQRRGVSLRATDEVIGSYTPVGYVQSLQVSGNRKLRWKRRRLDVGLCSDCGRRPLLTAWRCEVCTQRKELQRIQRRMQKYLPDTPEHEAYRKEVNERVIQQG